jgi:hypothetical protein
MLYYLENKHKKKKSVHIFFNPWLMESVGYVGRTPGHRGSAVHELYEIADIQLLLTFSKHLKTHNCFCISLSAISMALADINSPDIINCPANAAFTYITSYAL